MANKQLTSQTLEQRILDHLNCAVLLFDRHLQLRYINPAGEVLLAMSERHLLGQCAADLIRCPEGNLEDDLENALSIDQPLTEREIRILLPDDREVTVDCAILPVRDGRKPVEVMVELQQIDRQLRMNREEKLLSHHQATRALIRALAHEIKNPLGGLRGAAQLLEGELPEQSLHEYTQIIIDEADRLQALVNRLLGPNKLSDPREINLHQVLERVVSLTRVEVGDSIQLIRDYDPSIPPLWGDSNQLIQALLNITRNAVRAAGEGGQLIFRSRVLRQFTLGHRRYRLVAQIEVEDNGPGIPPEIKDQIFYPMVTLSRDGMGLGLSIAQSLINQHGGLIECKSRPGKTVFTVLIPLEKRYYDRKG